MVYKFILRPKLKLMAMKTKYGDEIAILHNYGSGILAEYRKGYTQERDSLHFLRKMAAEKKSQVKAYGFNFGQKVGVCFVDPELIKQVHQNHDAFSKVDLNQTITSLFSNSLLFKSGQYWQRQRQFLGKSFHFSEIKNYLPSIKDVCLKVSDSIFEELRNKSSQEIQVVKTCERVTSEVVFRVFFGSTSEKVMITRKDGTQVHITQELISLISDSFHILQTNKVLLLKQQILQKWHHKLLFKEEKELQNRLIMFKDACKNIVLNRKKELMDDLNLSKHNFLDLYLTEMLQNENTKVTINEIIDNFSALFFAGTDTTGNMTGVALYYLSLHNEIQEEARKEVISILEGRSSSKDSKGLFNSLQFEDLNQMNIITSILKESLRLIPPAAAVFARYANRDITIGNFELKQGDYVNTHFIYSQQNPDIFVNPERFDPYRWMDPKQSQHSAFNFTPFSLGQRNCIGQHLAMVEGKCMLANFLLNFNIIPNPKQILAREAKLIYGLNPDNLVFFQKRI